MVPAHIRGGPGMLTEPRAQNVAVALLTGNLLEQASSILQKRPTNLMPAKASSASQGVALTPCPPLARSSSSFHVQAFNPDCKKQYDTLMLRDIAKESMNSFLNQILSSREDTKTKYKVSQNMLL